MPFADLAKTLFIASSLLNNFSIFLNLTTPSGNNGDKNPPNCTILDICDFDNIILADKLFAKDLLRLETSVSVSKSSCRKLF